MIVAALVIGYVLGAIGMFMFLVWYGKKYHGKDKGGRQ